MHCVTPRRTRVAVRASARDLGQVLPSATRWPMHLGRAAARTPAAAVPHRALFLAHRVVNKTRPRRSFARTAAPKWRLLRYPALNAEPSCAKGLNSVPSAVQPRKRRNALIVNTSWHPAQSSALIAAPRPRRLETLR